MLAVMRGAAPPGCIGAALRSRGDVVTPMAPEHGLFLDEAFYDAYNARWGGQQEPLDFGRFRAAADAFRLQHVLPHIARQDWREMPFALWLRTLHEHSFRFSAWGAGRPGGGGSGGDGGDAEGGEGGGGPFKRQRLEPLDVHNASAGMVVAAQERYGLGKPQHTPRKAADAAAEEAAAAAVATAAAAAAAADEVAEAVQPAEQQEAGAADDAE